MEEQQIFLQPEMAIIGGGAVSSVNGYTGDVVLTTSDLENTSDYQTGSEVESAISIEVAAREAADNNLQTQIDGLSASSDVTDIVGTYAELQNYDTSTLGDNDIIKVLQDESQNGETTYYRWSTTTQSFTLIGEEGPYYTKAQADVLLNAKQDTLTAGTNIQISNNTISATDTTYSDFTGTDGTAAGAAGLVPAPATTDAGKVLGADGTWVTGGPTVVQTTGTSTTDVMSQNATTNMVFDDPGTNSKVKIGASSVGTGGISIGKYAGGTGNYSVTIGSGSSNGYGPWSAGRGSIAIGENANIIGGSGGVVRDYGVAIGANSIVNTGGRCEIALGAYSKATQQGQMDISTLATTNTYGYNASQYRLLTGLYDGQSAHDAATYGQVISYSAINGAGAPTTATEGKYVGQLYYDTTNEAMYFLKTIDTTTTPATYTWETLGGGSSVNVVQTNGTSTTDVMSQKAVTDLLFYNNAPQKVQIGASADSDSGGNVSSIAIGNSSKATTSDTIAIGTEASSLGSDDICLGRSSSCASSTYNSVAIGRLSSVTAPNSVAVGTRATATQQGQFDISTGDFAWGYNNSSYRLLTGLYDPQSAHDAATKGYVDSISSYSETEADTGATWIDGKTIYKKSYQQTITSNSQTFSLGIANLYEVVKIEAIWHAGGTLTNGMPTTISFPGDSGNSNSIAILTYGGTVEIDSNGRSGMKGVITIYYTKSS